MVGGPAVGLTEAKPMTRGLSTGELERRAIECSFVVSVARALHICCTAQRFCLGLRLTDHELGRDPRHDP